MINNLRINELLGATIFQKFVFRAESVKYTLIDKFFPNFPEKYERQLKKNLDKKLQKASTEEERQKIINLFRNNVLVLRKELNSKKNRNYHIEIDNPKKCIQYLKMNRRIHVRGLVINGGVFLISTLGIVFGNEIVQGFSYVTSGCNCVSTFINFECVNLQNYNLKRLYNLREKLEIVAQKRKERNVKSYGKISEVISKEFERTNEIPDVEVIVQGITSKEQLDQMRKLILDSRRYVCGSSKNRVKTKKEG